MIGAESGPQPSPPPCAGNMARKREVHLIGNMQMQMNRASVCVLSPPVFYKLFGSKPIYVDRARVLVLSLLVFLRWPFIGFFEFDLLEFSVRLLPDFRIIRTYWVNTRCVSVPMFT